MVEGGEEALDTLVAVFLCQGLGLGLPADEEEGPRWPLGNLVRATSNIGNEPLETKDGVEIVYRSKKHEMRT